MSYELLTFGLICTIAVGLLAFIMAARANQHDQVVEAAPKFVSLSELDAKIASEEERLFDVRSQKEAEQKKLDEIQYDQAEVDALHRMRQEILDEINRLGDRREEIREMDRETEAAVVRLADAKRDLDAIETELQQKQALLDQAESLASQISGLEDRERQLRQTVEALRTEASDLRQLQEDEKILRDTVERREREVARLEGLEQAAQQRLTSAQADLNDAQERCSETEHELVDLRAQAAAGAIETLKLEEARATLEARNALLRSKNGELDGTGSSEADPLRDLKVMPEVLSQLGALDTHEITEEQDALHRVKLTMDAYGLDYPERTIRAFHTAMKVNDTTQMAVLAGISGTGKSQLPRRYAEGMGIGFLQVPVQPRWDSPQDLMGFYNYIENRYRPTELAKALYHLDAFNGNASDAELQDRMMMILLDEMNLARVEYYFSDFLSRLESRPRRGEEEDTANRKDASIELELRMPEGESAPTIYPGYNLLFAGTMNEDESTQSLSDKVVDRANILRFAAPKNLKTQQGRGALPERKALTRTQWNNWLRKPGALGRDKNKVDEQIETLANIMRDLNRPIGHRMGIAMGAYVANYPEIHGSSDISVPLADQVEMRLLPKLRGVDMETADGPLNRLKGIVEGLNDTELAEAIQESITAADVTGQFSWKGVSRS